MNTGKYIYITIWAAFLFLTGFPACFSWAQQNQISISKEDSLQTVLKTYGRDTNRVKTLLLLVNAYRGKDLKIATEYANEALKLSETIKSKRLKASVLRALGNLHQLEGKYAIELTYYLEALPIYESLKDSLGISDCYNSIGNLYTNIDKFDRALEYHTMALDIRRRIKNERGIASSLNNIGNIYLSQKKSLEAIKNYEEALAINERGKNPAWKANNFSNLGIAYDDLKQYGKSLEYHTQALKIREELGNELQVAGSRIYLGFTYLHKGENQKAFENLSLGMAVKNGPLKLQEQGHQGFAEYWEKTGRFDSALKHYKIYIQIRDSLSGKNISVSVAESHTRFETLRKEKEAELEKEIFRLQQEADLKGQKLITWFFVAGAFFLLLLSGFFFYRFREKRKSEHLLEEKVEERTAQLLEANEELSKFIYQSSHDMRSPLTSIKGLLDIAKSEVPKGDPLRYLRLMGNRLDHLDGVYLSLIDFMNVKERVPAPEKIGLFDFMNLHIERVSERRPEHPVTFLNESDSNLTLDCDNFLLGIAVQNILLNSIDFSDSLKDPICRISGKKTGADFEIRIEDNGFGIRTDFIPDIFKMFKRGSNHSKGSGLGLYTAKMAAEKIGASISLSSEEGHGSTFILKISSGISAVDKKSTK